MIFGAGINQIGLIEAAHELGIVSVVADPLADPPGKLLSDFFYQIDGQDYEKTKTIAIRHKINGIVTGQMEKPLRLMARLASELQLDFHHPEVVERSLDKWLMKKAFLCHSIPCASGILVPSNENLTRQQLDRLNFPLIIKPRDAYSSRGVYKVISFSELLTHLEESGSFATKGEVIIEEFMSGREFSIETITWKSQTTIIQFTEKIITPYPNTVEMAHIQPANLTVTEKKAIAESVKSGIAALGINNSAGHVEVMLTTSGAKIVEIGARLGGDFISSYLTKSSTGVSMDKAAVQMALGIEPDLSFGPIKYAMIQYLELPVAKKVRDVLPIDDLLQQTGIVFAWIFAKPNDVIPPITHSAVRPACVIVEATNRTELLKRAQKFAHDLKERIILY